MNIFIYIFSELFQVEVIYNNNKELIYASSNSSEVISVADFIVDYNSLTNSNVCVKGSIFAMGNIIGLIDVNNPMSQISLNIDNLTRTTKKEIITKCNGIGNNCIQTICGTARDINYTQGLIVNEIK